MKKIAVIKTDFPTKFGLPRQSGLIKEIKGTIIFEKPYRIDEALRGIEDFSHLWLIWETSETKGKEWSPTVRPPLLGGNKRMGVFATRSPFRPNPIGLSCVRLDSVEKTQKYGTVLHVSGVDIMDNTPIYDIKPYLVYADSHPDAKSGFTENLAERKIEVQIQNSLLECLPEEKREELIGPLSCDPRPSYIEDSERIYGFLFCGFEIKFRVNNNKLIVTEIIKP